MLIWFTIIGSYLFALICSWLTWVYLSFAFWPGASWLVGCLLLVSLCLGLGLDFVCVLLFVVLLILLCTLFILSLIVLIVTWVCMIWAG